MPYRNPEDAQAYERRRPKRHRDRRGRKQDPEYQKEWHKTHPNYRREWNHSHPGYQAAENRARQQLARSRRAGTVNPLPCEICGETARIEGHHAFGYTPEMALVAWWLCKPHHAGMHALIRSP